MPKVVKNTKSKNKKRPAKAQSLLANVGRELGGLIGPTTARMGGMAGAAISRILGMGDYKINGNSLSGGQAPRFISTDTGMRICHREFISDVKTSTEFSNQFQAYINPGNKTMFPWLSSIASSFEQYELHGLVVTYKPTSGTAVSSTNAAMGSVILSTEYDVLKPLFQSKREAEAYHFTTVSVPYEGMIHPIECKPSLTVLPKKFVTTVLTPTGLSGDDDPRLHYQGLFQLMAAGQQTSGFVSGELWVSYDVSFYTPRLPEAVSHSSSRILVTPLPSSTGHSALTSVKPVRDSDCCSWGPLSTSPSSFIEPKLMFLKEGVYRLSISNIHSNNSIRAVYGTDPVFSTGVNPIQGLCGSLSATINLPGFDYLTRSSAGSNYSAVIDQLNNIVWFVRVRGARQFFDFPRLTYGGTGFNGDFAVEQYTCEFLGDYEKFAPPYPTVLANSPMYVSFSSLLSKEESDSDGERGERIRNSVASAYVTVNNDPSVIGGRYN